MKKVTAQGQTVPFRTFKRDKYIEGGLLETSIEIQVRNHNNILHFSSLYRWVDTGKLLGGDLSFPHYVHMAKCWVPAISVLFYKDFSDYGDNLDIELLNLPVPLDAPIVVGYNRYTFAKSSTVTFHSNGQLMSGILKSGSSVKTAYGNILSMNVSFGENGELLALTPSEDVTLKVSGKSYSFMGGNADYSPSCYTLHFSLLTGKIVWGILSSGDKIDFTRLRG